MGKGQGAIVLLIIVGLVALFLIFSPQLFKAGPTTAPIAYKNDIISLENFEISNLKPIKGSKLTISFDLLNNGDKTVDYVEVDFTGTTNQGNINIRECEGVTPDNSNKKCRFQNLLSLDTRKVVAEYTAPDPFSARIEVKTTYPYKGSREASIPIVDDKTVRTPQVKFRQSQPSFGPFAVDVIPPTKGWAIADHPFELAFKLRFVGSTAVSTPIEPLDKLKIEKGKVTVNLQGLEVVSCPQLTKTSGVVITNKDIDMVVNKEYSCNFQATGATGTFGYKLGIVKINFNYDYGFVRSQTITIRPTPSPTEPSKQVQAPTTTQKCEDIRDSGDCGARGCEWVNPVFEGQKGKCVTKEPTPPTAQPTPTLTPTPAVTGTTLEGLAGRLNKPKDDPDVKGFFDAIQAAGGEQQALDKLRGKSLEELFEKSYYLDLDSWREFKLCGETFPGDCTGVTTYCYKGTVVYYPSNCGCPPGQGTKVGELGKSNVNLCKSFGTPVSITVKKSTETPIKIGESRYIDMVLLDPQGIIVSGINSDDVTFETTLGEVIGKSCTGSPDSWSCDVRIKSNQPGTATITGTYKNLKATIQVQFVSP